MRAAILAIGSELLGTVRLDTNSLRLTAVLREYGVDVAYKAVIGDSRAGISGEVRRLAGVFDLLLVTGGLGPTEDDLTREAVGDALGRGLRRQEEILYRLRRRFAHFGVEMPPANEKQADVIEGAAVIDNRRGTAPGLRVDPADEDEATIFLFPGVPHELEGMISSALTPWLEERSDGTLTETAVLKIACVQEARVEDELKPFYAEHGSDGDGDGDGFSVLASPGEVQLHVTATGPEEERAAHLGVRLAALRSIFGRAVFSEAKDVSLESAVGGLLRERQATVVTAESCTAGLLAERLTREAGSSDYFLGAFVTYSNELKAALLDVPADDLERHGAVSEPVVRAMAEGARKRLDAEYSIAVSGIAGPGGGSEDKPVGTVHLAVASPSGVEHRHVRLPGDRERVRWLASQWGLDFLRRRLLDDMARTGADVDEEE